jgi:hypothetical protein
MRRRRNSMPCAPNRRRRAGAVASTIQLSFGEPKAAIYWKTPQKSTCSENRKATAPKKLEAIHG